MADNQKYKRALEFVTKKHEGQFRTGGLPYFTHPVAVAEILKQDGYNVNYQIAGLFHDLLEDTDATQEEILALGGQSVLNAVKLLTKQKNYVMQEYVENICANPIAKAVKSADRLHNLTCATVCSEQFKQRYIIESVDWYLGFDKRILPAIINLIKSMQNPNAVLEKLKEKSAFELIKKQLNSSSD